MKDIFPNISTINPSQPNYTPSAADSTISTALLNNLANVYDNLLNDAEPEVRAAASIHLSLIGKYLPKAMLITRLLPSIQRLVGDNSDFVRAVISNEISQISPLLGKEDTIKHILPLLLNLLRDEASDVRLNVISHLDGIHLTLGVEQLSQSLLPAIIALAQDTKWRVRLAIIELMPIISKQLGSDIFTEHLLSVNMEWLNDRVFSIRKVAATNLRHIANLFGEEWTLKHILPNLEKLHQHSSYIQRMTSLYTVQVLLEAPSAKTAPATASSSSSIAKSSNYQQQTQQIVFVDQKINMNIMKLLIHNVLRLLNDNVANVRLTLAKTLSIALQSLLTSSTTYYDNAVYTTIINALNTLVGDGDRDVRFYAKEVSNLRIHLIGFYE
jgi:HEAT repeat protein